MIIKKTLSNSQIKERIVALDISYNSFKTLEREKMNRLIQCKILRRRKLMWKMKRKNGDQK